MNEGNECKNELNEKDLEQVCVGESGYTVWKTALYCCPVCHLEQKRTSRIRLPSTCLCPCGANMERVPGSITMTVE